MGYQKCPQCGFIGFILYGSAWRCRCGHEMPVSAQPPDGYRKTGRGAPRSENRAARGCFPCLVLRRQCARRRRQRLRVRTFQSRTARSSRRPAARTSMTCPCTAARPASIRRAARGIRERASSQALPAACLALRGLGRGARRRLRRGLYQCRYPLQMFGVPEAPQCQPLLPPRVSSEESCRHPMHGQPLRETRI